LLSDTVFKIRSATSVLRRVVRSGYKEADLRYENRTFPAFEVHPKYWTD
jgi:hypothetical protein